MKFPQKLFRSPIECCHIDAKNQQVPFIVNLFYLLLIFLATIVFFGEEAKRLCDCYLFSSSPF